MCCCAIPAPRAPPFAPPLAPPLPCARRNLAGSFPLVLKQVNGDGKIDIAATTTTGFGALYILFLDSVHNLLSFMKLVPTDGMVGGCAGPFPLFALSRAHVKRFPATPPPVCALHSPVSCKRVLSPWPVRGMYSVHPCYPSGTGMVTAPPM